MDNAGNLLFGTRRQEQRAGTARFCTISWGDHGNREGVVKPTVLFVTHK